jgi:hypothetical protein
MSDPEAEYREDLAAQHAVEDAKYDDLTGNREDDPPEEYLQQEAEQRAQWHRDAVHGGRPCDCPPPPLVYSDESPF